VVVVVVVGRRGLQIGRTRCLVVVPSHFYPLHGQALLEPGEHCGLYTTALFQIIIILIFCIP